MFKEKTGSRKMSGFHRTLCAASCLAAAVLMPAASQAADPVRVGSILALGTSTVFVSQELGYFEEAGLDVEVLEFADGSALMEAFAAGELDLALVGIAPAATWNAKGIDLKVIAGANGGGHVLMTKSDSGIDTVADLSGKLLAEPNLATVTDALLRAQILPDAGLTPDMDVTLIPGMKPADMAAALMGTGEVDAIITWEPYAAQAEAQYGDEIKVLYNAPAELAGEDGSFYPCNMLIATGAFMAEQPEQLAAYLEVHKKTSDYLNTDEGANAVLGSVLQLDEAVISAARERIDFNTEVDTDAALQVLQWSADLGYIEEVPAAEDLFALQ